MYLPFSSIQPIKNNKSSDSTYQSNEITPWRNEALCFAWSSFQIELTVVLRPTSSKTSDATDINALSGLRCFEGRIMSDDAQVGSQKYRTVKRSNLEQQERQPDGQTEKSFHRQTL